jgi:transcriptional regulator with XRE-family HTH domain
MAGDDEELDRPVSARAAAELDRALGSAIRVRRLALGVTQQDLAIRCGISFQQIQKYENGSNRIAFSRVAQIAEALETTVGDLAGALTPATGRTEYLEHVRMLAAPGAADLLAAYLELPPTAQRCLTDWVRQLSRDARGAATAKPVP